MATNVVEQTRAVASAALKRGNKHFGAEMTPAKWAAEAGFSGSAASPLRAHMARVSGNGCGRSGRYPKMDAGTLLETLDLADNFVAAEGDKRAALAKRIRTKVRPAANTGARQAKTQAKAAPKATKSGGTRAKAASKA